MKKLTEFLNFDIEGFIKDKEIIFLEERPWYEYIDGQRGGEKGIKATLVIIRDNTKYSDPESTNVFEKFDVNVQTDKESLNIRKQTPVELYDVSKATVYGNYNNLLSITGKIRPKQTKNNG